MLLRGFFFLLENSTASECFDCFRVVLSFFLISDFELQSDLPIADRHPQTDGIERGG